MTLELQGYHGDVQHFTAAENNFDSRFSLMSFPSLFGNLLGKTAIKVIHVGR